MYVSSRVTHEMDTLNIRSTSFVTFIVKEDGKTDSIFCNKGTPSILEPLFISAVKSSDDYWKTIDGTNKKSQRFIIPLSYLFSRGKVTVDDRTEISIRNMLVFSVSDKAKNPPLTVSPVDCIILPYTFFSGIIN